jgi:nucleoid DNA-binding protein
MADIFSKIAQDGAVKGRLKNQGANNVVGMSTKIGAWDKIAQKIADKKPDIAEKFKEKIKAELATAKKTVTTTKKGGISAVGFGSFSVTKKSTTAKSLPTQLEEVGAEVELKSAVNPDNDGRIEIEQDIEATKPDGLTTQLKEIGADVEIKSSVTTTDAPEEEEVQMAAGREGGRTVGAGQVTEIIE